MPASGPLSGGWSMWDIGCCCGDNLCGCDLVDNHEEDFSTGSIDENWTVTDIGNIEIVDQELVLHQPDQLIINQMSRCIVLPDLTNKKVSCSFTYLADFELSAALLMYAEIELAHEVTGGICQRHANAALSVRNSFLGTAGGSLQSPYGSSVGGAIQNTPPQNITFRFDITREETSPEVWRYYGRWYANGVLKLTLDRPVTAFTDDVATLYMRWQTGEDLSLTGPMVIDNVLFGVYDV